MGFWIRSPIDISGMITHVSGADRGGTAVFVGSVRAGVDDGPVSRIEYTGYEPMVDAEFAKIVGEAVARWPELRIEAIHRLGTVPVGEPSIAVVAATPHRNEAFEACRYVVEHAKKRLPVWKKEIFEDGSQSWRANRLEEETGPRGTGNVREDPAQRSTSG